MKKYLFLFALAAGLLSCTVEKDSAPASVQDPVRFAASSVSRAAFSQGLSSIAWNDGDRVGIFALKGGDVIGINYPYSIVSADGSAGDLTAVSSLYQYSSRESAGAEFLAYYPFSGNAGDGNRHVVPAILPPAQEQATAGDVSHLTDYLILRAAPVTLSEDGVSVNLAFRNMTAVAEIVLKASAACNRSISSVVLKAAAPLAFERGSLLLNPGDASPFTINEASDSVVLRLGTAFRLGTEGSSVYFTLAPGIHAAGSISVKLIASDGYVAEAQIPEGVSFESNGVYSKTVSVDPSSFHKEGAPVERYIWKPVTATTSVKAGDCLITYNYSYSGTSGTFALPGTAVVKNPIPKPLSELDLEFDEAGNIVSEVPELYIWKFTAATGGWHISCGNLLLGGCDQAQGLAISSDGNGSYSPGKTYGTVWVLSDLDNYGMQFGLPSGITTRRAMPYYDPTNGLDHFEWRMVKTDTGGYVLYYKTLVDDE